MVDDIVKMIWLQVHFGTIFRIKNKMFVLLPIKISLISGLEVSQFTRFTANYN